MTIGEIDTHSQYASERSKGIRGTSKDGSEAPGKNHNADPSRPAAHARRLRRPDGSVRVERQNVTILHVLIDHLPNAGDIGGMAGIAGAELLDAHIDRIAPTHA